MRKRKFLLSMILLSGLLGGCTGQQTVLQEAMQQSSDQALDQALDEAMDEAKALARYTDYGMTFDVKSRILTYEGQRVRYFEDLYPINKNTPEDGMAGMTFFDENGIVDVYATRDLNIRQVNDDGSYDPSGALTGLAPFGTTHCQMPRGMAG